jgi:hypothetical protein
LQVFDATQFLDFLYYLLYRVHNLVCMRDGWVGYSFVLKVNCVSELFFLGGFDVACMCAVVIW